MRHKPFIALDWGTTSFRAYLVAADGVVQDQFAAAEGILAVKDGDFEAVLESHIGSWDKSLPVVAAGMITSRQGWVELAYADCPAGPADIAKHIHVLKARSGRTIHFLTGLHLAGGLLGHDVMRSEETQVFGSLDVGASHFVTPGTHSKWIDVVDGRIVNFATYITGEMFSVLRNHSIRTQHCTGLHLHSSPGRPPQRSLAARGEDRRRRELEVMKSSDDQHLAIRQRHRGVKAAAARHGAR